MTIKRCSRGVSSLELIILSEDPPLCWRTEELTHKFIAACLFNAAYLAELLSSEIPVTGGYVKLQLHKI